MGTTRNKTIMGAAASTSNDPTVTHIRATVLDGRPLDVSDINVSIFHFLLNLIVFGKNNDSFIQTNPLFNAIKLGS